MSGRRTLAVVRRWLAPRARFDLWRRGTADLRRYLRELDAYTALPGAEPLTTGDLIPRLGDWTHVTPLDAHYFHMGIWAARRVREQAPARHVDVGSDIHFVGLLTTITAVEFIDIRPLTVTLAGLTTRAGSVLALPHASASVPSLSCLHVAEHVGLGRYGDPLDPLGTRKAARELSRVLAPGGMLLFALPVGRERVCFNAHRVHAPETIVGYFAGLELTEFSAVDDAGAYCERVALDAFRTADYACGLFAFRKPGP